MISEGWNYYYYYYSCRFHSELSFRLASVCIWCWTSGKFLTHWLGKLSQVQMEPYKFPGNWLSRPTSEVQDASSLSPQLERSYNLMFSQLLWSKKSSSYRFTITHQPDFWWLLQTYKWQTCTITGKLIISPRQCISYHVLTTRQWNLHLYFHKIDGFLSSTYF